MQLDPARSQQGSVPTKRRSRCGRHNLNARIAVERRVISAAPIKNTAEMYAFFCFRHLSRSTWVFWIPIRLTCNHDQRPLWHSFMSRRRCWRMTRVLYLLQLLLRPLTLPRNGCLLSTGTGWLEGNISPLPLLRVWFKVRRPLQTVSSASLQAV